MSSAAGEVDRSASESDSGSDSASDAPVEFLAVSREKRSTAGSKMAQLLNKEDADEFYQSTYGGFFDEEGDVAFAPPTHSDEDVVDSDFDASEREDEPMSDEDGGDAPKRKRRRAGVTTKAYKEPVAGAGRAAVKRKRPASPADDAADTGEPAGKRALRTSTVALRPRSADWKRADTWRPIGGRQQGHERLTQKQLLEEAKRTEVENLKSLQRYEQYEEEQREKRDKLIRRRSAVTTGPRVTFLSLRMRPPGGNEHSWEARDFLCYRDDSSVDGAANALRRAFAPFRNDANDEQRRRHKAFVDSLAAHVPAGAPAPARPVCPVSGRPARYKDPKSGVCYADAAAFKRVRREYERYLLGQTERCDHVPGLRQWIEWKERSL